jgi:hypothetical protein
VAAQPIPSLSVGQLMERLGGEAFMQRLTGMILDLAAATDETGQAGSLTFKVKTFKEKGSERRDGYVGFAPTVSVSAPKPALRPTGLYVSERGFHADDPRQQAMELRAVEASDGETRQVQVGAPAARSV